MSSSYLQRIQENSAYVRARLADIKVDIEKLKDERDALKVENAALRKALEQITGKHGWEDKPFRSEALRIARAALESSTQGREE